MSLPRKLIGYGGVLALVGVLGAGVYYRISGKSSEESGGGEASSRADMPAVSASQAGFDASIAIAVEGVPVIRDTLSLGVKADGEAASYRQTILSAHVNGPVQSVAAGEGGLVGAGMLVLAIDSSEHQLDLDEARAGLAQAQNQYREITLWDDRIPDAELRASREQAARLKAGLDAAETRVQRAEINLTRTRVRAPFGGRVANLEVVPGQYVTTGTELMTIVDLDPIKVEVNVLEADVAHLEPGRGARVTFAAFPGEVFDGRIESINPVVDSRTRMARVTVLVPNRDGRILPGFYARITLDARRLPDRVIVPRESILERDGRTLVFLFDGEGDGEGEAGQAMWQYVSTGFENDAYVEIIEDPEDTSTRLLRPGEIVLVEGHRMLTHAARVRLVTNAAAEGGRPR